MTPLLEQGFGGSLAGGGEGVAVHGGPEGYPEWVRLDESRAPEGGEGSGVDPTQEGFVIEPIGESFPLGWGDRNG